MPWSAASHTRLCPAGRPYSMRLKGSRLTDWPAPVPMRLIHRTVQVISNGDLLCFRNKGSCRRSFDARSQSVAFGEYSTGLFILASTLSEKFVDMKLWKWSDAENSYEAPRQTPWIHCRDMGSQTMQMISNGGLLGSGNTGSCRRSFDALVCRRTHSAMSSWPSLSSSVFITRGRADGALMQVHKVWPSVSIQVCLVLTIRSRPGKSGGPSAGSSGSDR